MSDHENLDDDTVNAIDDANEAMARAKLEAAGFKVDSTSDRIGRLLKLFNEMRDERDEARCHAVKDGEG